MMKAVVGALLFSIGSSPAGALAAHGVAQFGEPKYPASFSHFEYADPEAVRGGTLNLSVVSENTSFDKLNPFSLRGKAAPGLVELTFETLTVLSLDEVNNGVPPFPWTP